MAKKLFVPPQPVEWTPPPKGTIKLNCDGGLSRYRGCGVGAGIFRDHKGSPVASYACSHPAYMGHTPYDAEVGSLYLGLRIAYNHGITNLWIESDAKLLIDVLRSGRPNLWYDKDVVNQIRDLLARFPQEPMMTHIHREGNRAADALVRYMCENISIAVHFKWDRDEKLPSKVSAIVDRECNGYTYLRKGCYISQ